MPRPDIVEVFGRHRFKSLEDRLGGAEAAAADREVGAQARLGAIELSLAAILERLPA